MPSPKIADRGLLGRLQDNALINSTQLIGLVAILIAGAILLFLAGVIIPTAVLGLILTSPIWVPIAAVLLVAGGGLLLAFLAVAPAAAGVTWSYKYFRGRHPPGSERVDYARGRIADTAGQVKEYAREYGGYIQKRVRDVAPDAAPGA